jgi:hypothetical protein
VDMGRTAAEAVSVVGMRLWIKKTWALPVLSSFGGCDDAA